MSYHYPKAHATDRSYHRGDDREDARGRAWFEKRSPWYAKRADPSCGSWVSWGNGEDLKVSAEQMWELKVSEEKSDFYEAFSSP